MQSRPESGEALTETPPDPTPDNVEPLLLPLIRRLRSQRHADDVLLDVEMEGVRCVLIERGPEASPASLSPREHEIARMVASGYPNKKIAAVLNISAWTVSTHLRRVFAKLGVRSRAAMVARLAEEGLLTGVESDGEHDRPGPRLR